MTTADKTEQKIAGHTADGIPYTSPYETKAWLPSPYDRPCSSKDSAVKVYRYSQDGKPFIEFDILNLDRIWRTALAEIARDPKAGFDTWISSLAEKDRPGAEDRYSEWLAAQGYRHHFDVPRGHRYPTWHSKVNYCPPLQNLGSGRPPKKKGTGGKNHTPCGPVKSDSGEATFNFTDLGNAGRLINKYCATIRYQLDQESFAVYDRKEGRWRISKEAATQVAFLATQVPQIIKEEPPGTATKEEKATYDAWALRTEDHARLSALVKVAKSHPSIGCHAPDFDVSPHLFSAANGTIDLKTGILRNHDPADMITRQSPITYDPEAKADRWIRALDEIFGGDQETIGFFRRWCGYGMTGEVSDQYFPINYGEGANGKDLVMKILLYVMGDYAGVADPDLLRATREPRHPVSVETIRGKRLVFISESDPSVKIDEAMLKRLTGTDSVTSRGMHKNFSTFAREAKFFFAANHLPTFRGTDDGLWRRILKVAWPVEFVNAGDPLKPIVEGERRRLPKDPKVDQALRDEGSGILTWLVKAAQEWYTERLTPPSSILISTAEYRRDLDTVAQFIESRCKLHRDFKCPGGELLKAYREWMGKEHPDLDLLSSTFLGLELGRKGFPKLPKSHGIVHRGGLELMQDWELNGDGPAHPDFERPSTIPITGPTGTQSAAR